MFIAHSHVTRCLKHDADRTLIYLTLYITECLRRLQKVSDKSFLCRFTSVRSIPPLAFSVNRVPKRRKNCHHWPFQHFPFQVTPIFHSMECSPNQPTTKSVSEHSPSPACHLESNVRRHSLLLDKMKQYLEQLRKECSDRMIERVIDPETDKPSKVKNRCLTFEGSFLSFD